VEAATRAVLPLLKEGDLYVIESTSPVGTTEAMARLIFSERPELEDRIYVAYCPERVLPGNVIYELIHNDRVHRRFKSLNLPIRPLDFILNSCREHFIEPTVVLLKCAN